MPRYLAYPSQFFGDQFAPDDIVWQVPELPPTPTPTPAPSSLTIVGNDQIGAVGYWLELTGYRVNTSDISDTVTVYIVWGDGLSSEAVVDPESGEIQAEHIYIEAQIYTLLVQATSERGTFTADEFTMTVYTEPIEATIVDGTYEGGEFVGDFTTIPLGFVFDFGGDGRIEDDVILTTTNPTNALSIGGGFSGSATQSGFVNLLNLGIAVPGVTTYRLEYSKVVSR